MSRALIVIGHPDPTSLTHEAAATAKQVLESRGVETSLHDLYAEGFDPLLTREDLARRYSFDPLVQEYITELEAATHLVIAHPVWWGVPPAIVKGWVDRVFIPTVAYEYEGEEFLRKQRRPLLTELRALVLGGTDEAESGEPTTLERFWRDEVFAFCGARVSFHTIYGLRESSFAERRAWLDAIAPMIAEWE